MKMYDSIKLQISNLESEIKTLSLEIDHLDSVSQPYSHLSKKLAEKQGQLEAMVKFVSNQDASLSA